MSIIGVIHSRWGSTRFPGKSLAPLCGKPLVKWVVEACLRAKTLDAVVVATDEPRIAKAVAGYAWGIGPNKDMVDKGFGTSSTLVADAHPGLLGTSRAMRIGQALGIQPFVRVEDAVSERHRPAWPPRPAIEHQRTVTAAPTQRRPAKHAGQPADHTEQ